MQGVLRAAKACLHKREAELHEHDEEARDERPCVVDAEPVLIHLRGELRREWLALRRLVHIRLRDIRGRDADDPRVRADDEAGRIARHFRVFLAARHGDDDADDPNDQEDRRRYEHPCLDGCAAPRHPAACAGTCAGHLPRCHNPSSSSLPGHPGNDGPSAGTSGTPPGEHTYPCGAGLSAYAVAASLVFVFASFARAGSGGGVRGFGIPSGVWARRSLRHLRADRPRAGV